MTTATNRKRVSAQARKAATSSELAPLYAVAGLTEVLTNRLRTVATESREQLSGKSLQDLVRAFPEFTKQQLARFGEYADARREKAGAAYAELAGRGKIGVDGALGDAKESIDPVLERLQGELAKLRQTVTGRGPAEDEPTA